MTNCNRCGEECDGEMVENEGGVACQAGIPLSENPYHADRMISEKRAWARGWCDEDASTMGKKESEK